MMTSTFLPATAPPLPPPPPLDDPPEARPATTPTTTAISAMAATSESENFTRVLVIGSLVSPTSGLSQLRTTRRERFQQLGECRGRLLCCQENTFSSCAISATLPPPIHGGI